MPFTPSHAVVALPFVRTRLVPAAIAVGAMTPDLPLFVRGTPVQYGLTHDLRWIALTVLLALVLLLVWRCVLRPAARELLPGGVARRLPVTWDRGPRAALRETFPPSWGDRILLVVSLVLGVCTHVVWDAFTHEGRLGTVLVPALAAQWGPFEGYRWLQYASGVLGVAVLGVFGIRWIGRRRPRPVRRTLPRTVRAGWWLSLPCCLILAWVWGLFAMGPLTADFTVAHLAYRVLPPACAAWGALTLVVCAVITASSRTGVVRTR
ncbi:DUF4184 family protein [Microbacterium sp. GXF7504]